MDTGVFVEWEITRACGLKCRHCHQERNGKGELPGEEKLALARKLAGGGVAAVAISGGEPADCLELWPAVEILRNAGIAVSVITNGQADPVAFAQRCRKASLAMAWVSIDGPAAFHDDLRRRPGAFAKAVACVRSLVANGVPAGVMTTLLRTNLAHLPYLANLTAELGATYWQINLGVFNRRHPELFLDPNALPSLQLADLARKTPILRFGEGLAMALGLAEDGCICPAGRTALCVGADGRVRGCALLPAAPGDAMLLSESLSDVIKQEKLRAQARDFSASACTPEHGCCHAAFLRRQQPKPARKSAVCLAAGAASILLAACTTSRLQPTPAPGPPPYAGYPSEPAAPIEEAPEKNAYESAPSQDATETPPMASAPQRTDADTPSTAKPAMKPEPCAMPRCCVAHVYNPDCVCTPPTDQTSDP